MSERLTIQKENGKLAIKFDGQPVPAGKLPALFDLLAADMERRKNQLLAAGDHRQISRCIPLNGVTMREGSTPSRGTHPCPRCGYCGFIEDADMNLAGMCPECRGEGRVIIQHNAKRIDPPTQDPDTPMNTQTTTPLPPQTPPEADNAAGAVCHGAPCSGSFNVSETPETDDESMSNPYQGEVVKASFARKMERQRNALRKVQYPMESAEQLAGCLIQHGLIEEEAWHDYEDYDGGITLGRIYKMQAACARIILPNA